MLKKIWSGAYSVQTMANICLILGTAALLFIQVLLRYVFKAPLMGIEELIIFPSIWMYMLGGASASWERSHIDCGILTLLIKREFCWNLFFLIRCVIMVGISCWLLKWAWWYFSYSMRVGKTSALLHIPMFIAESSIFVGLLLMTIYSAVEMVDYGLAVFGLKKKTKE